MENFSERVAFYPGSFNPFTVGHADIVKRALTVCDRLVVALGHNPAKKGYDASELADRIRAIYADEPRVCVMVYDGLSAHAAREAGASFMIRGVRSSADFEFERTLAETNLKVFGMETLLMPALPELAFVSSSMVRELQSFGHDISEFIPKAKQK
jgi:pantetheine-phosphate adenylyltransferase